MTTRSTITLGTALALVLTFGIAGATTTVNEATLAPAGWQVMNTNTAAVTFENGPAATPSGTGSVRFATGSGDGTLAGVPLGGVATLNTGNHNGTRLDDLTSFTYSTYVQQSGLPGWLAPTIVVQVDIDGDAKRDTTLVFEPGRNASPQVVDGAWQSWDLLSQPKWWLTKATSSLAAGGSGMSLATILAAHPDATIVDWDLFQNRGLSLRAGQNSGGSWASFVGNADELIVATASGTTTYDFETIAP